MNTKRSFNLLLLPVLAALMFAVSGSRGSVFCVSPWMGDLPPASQAAASGQREEGEEKHIGNVENGLLPAVLVKGQPASRMVVQAGSQSFSLIKLQ